MDIKKVVIKLIGGTISVVFQIFLVCLLICLIAVGFIDSYSRNVAEYQAMHGIEPSVAISDAND